MREVGLAGTEAPESLDHQRNFDAGVNPNAQLAFKEEPRRARQPIRSHDRRDASSRCSDFRQRRRQALPRTARCRSAERRQVTPPGRGWHWHAPRAVLGPGPVEKVEDPSIET
jgi:hypothetical protein